MSRERVLLCGQGTKKKARDKANVLRLQLGENGNVHLKISDLNEKLVSNLPPLLVDLLEIAAYVFAADQAIPRGGAGAIDYGKRWYRRLRFQIPVRRPAVWSSQTILSTLRNTLQTLSDDDYEFTFTKLTDPPRLTDYLEFGPGGHAEEVILVSGDIDSLGGAIQEALIDKRPVALVSHRSSPKIGKRQHDLVAQLRERAAQRPVPVPVWLTKDKALNREYTQRTRSFLYAALGAVVARLFGLKRIRFYENGILSIHLPISEQLIGSRASRTTHPRVLNGYADLFSNLFGEPFAVENPFLWKTKGEVVRLIRDAGQGSLLKDSVSCVHTWEMTKAHSHCGKCSQCIDRRFATLAAGCTEAEDPAGLYAMDLLTGERPAADLLTGDDKASVNRTLLESFVRTARRIKDMSDFTFFTEFGEVNRVTGQIRGLSVHDAACRIFDLYKRHAAAVCDVVAGGIREHAQAISDGTLPDSCLLVLALPESYRTPLPLPPESPPPLTETEQKVLDLILAQQEGKGITGRQNIATFTKQDFPIEQNTLTTQIIPKLKEWHGVQNRRGVGYYVPRSERGNRAAMAR